MATKAYVLIETAVGKTREVGCGPPRPERNLLRRRGHRFL